MAAVYKKSISRAKKVIEQTVTQITKALEEQRDLEALFFEVLAKLGEERNCIALDHCEVKGEEFGLRRDKGPKWKGFNTCTPLDERYEQYSQNALKYIAKVVKEMPPSAKETKLQEMQQEVKFEIIDSGTVKKEPWSTLKPDLLWERLQILLGPSLPKEAKPEPKAQLYEVIWHDKEASRLFKEKDPALYECVKYWITMRELQVRSPKLEPLPSFDHQPIPQNSDKRKVCNPVPYFLLVKIRIEIEGKPYDLSQYLIWLYGTLGEDSASRIQLCSKVMILHQDPFLIEPTLKEIAKIFAKALQWDRKDQRELLHQMALMRYLFAHAMPFSRGSSAIGEWMEVAMFRTLGFSKFDYNLDRHIDLEALSSISLSQYTKKYEEITTTNSKPKRSRNLLDEENLSE